MAKYLSLITILVLFQWPGKLCLARSVQKGLRENIYVASILGPGSPKPSPSIRILLLNIVGVVMFITTRGVRESLSRLVKIPIWLIVLINHQITDLRLLCLREYGKVYRLPYLIIKLKSHSKSLLSPFLTRILPKAIISHPQGQSISQLKASIQLWLSTLNSSRVLCPLECHL